MTRYREQAKQLWRALCCLHVQWWTSERESVKVIEETFQRIAQQKEDTHDS